MIPITVFLILYRPLRSGISRAESRSFVLFDLSFMACCCSRCPNRARNAIFFFALHVVLGFWMKEYADINERAIAEPIGNFMARRGVERALAIGSAGAIEIQ